MTNDGYKNINQGVLDGDIDCVNHGKGHLSSLLNCKTMVTCKIKHLQKCFRGGYM